MIIHGPVQPQAEYDIDLGPVFITDCVFHFKSSVK